MPPVRQTSFTAGEISPQLWGRTDLERFAHGMRTMRNFFPTKQGEAVSRPGTKYLAAPKDPVGGSQKWKLVPFVYSDSQTYVIELSHGYARFICNGEYVGTGNAFVAYNSLTSPFVVGATVAGLNSGNSGVIAAITILTPTTGILELTGLTGSLIAGEQLNDTLFGSGTATAPEHYAPYEVVTGLADTFFDKLKWVQSGDVLTFTHPGLNPFKLSRLAHTNWVVTSISFARHKGYSYTGPAVGAYLLAPLPVPTAAEPAQVWRWAVTLLYRDATYGFVSESAPLVITKTATALPAVGAAATGINVACYQDLPVSVLMPATGVAAGLNGWPVATRIYRGRGNTFGWVGDVEWGQETFIDTGREPDYAIQPPIGQNPFEVYSNATTLVRTEEPAAVSYFQERLCFGGTAERPGYFFCSKTGDYYNFDVRYVPVAGESLVFELASRKREEIRALLSLNRLLAFTNSSVWSISGHQGSPLDFDSVDARVVEEVGIGLNAPLSVNGCALYARAKGRGARALIPAGTASGFTGVDISNDAQHLFFGDTSVGIDGGSIVDWCFAEDPYGLVWAAMSDGALLSLTFNHETNQWGWARHDTGRRLEGGNEAADGVVVNICSVPEGNEDAVYLVVQRWTAARGTFMCVERMHSRIAAEPVSLDSATECVFDIWSVTPPTTMHGLDHLEGMEVYAVPTGNNAPQGPFTVTGGEITIADYASAVGPARVWVGLKYTPDLETLDLSSAAVRMKQKTTVRVGFEVNQSRGLSGGQDFDHLTEWRQHTVGSGYASPTAATQLVRILVSGKWDEAGRACLRQTLPLPVTVLGITREIDLGD